MPWPLIRSLVADKLVSLGLTALAVVLGSVGLLVLEPAVAGGSRWFSGWTFIRCVLAPLS